MTIYPNSPPPQLPCHNSNQFRFIRWSSSTSPSSPRLLIARTRSRSPSCPSPRRLFTIDSLSTPNNRSHSSRNSDPWSNSLSVHSHPISSNIDPIQRPFSIREHRKRGAQMDSVSTVDVEDEQSMELGGITVDRAQTGEEDVNMTMTHSFGIHNDVSLLLPSCSSSSLIGPHFPLPSVDGHHFIDSALPSDLLANLKEFKENDLMCDVEIEVDGRVIRAHRYVLAAGIPYFRAMFSTGMKEANMSRITMNDISFESLRLLVNYVYSCEIEINSDNVQQLIFAASILQIDSVCSACQRFMTQYLTTSNCLLIRQFAEQHNCTNLLLSSDDFAVDHFAELRRLSEFRSIPFTHLRDLIKRSDLKVKTEEEVFETVMEWIREDKDSRIECLPQLLSFVRVTQLPLNYILTVVKQDPLIKDDRACTDIVSEAMFELLKELNCGGANVAIGNLLRDDVGGSQYCAGSSISSSIRNLSSEGLSIQRNRPRKSMAGVIFCVGGRGTAGDPFRSVEAFDWRKNKWFSVADMNAQRRHVGVVSAQGKLFAIGGHDGLQHLATAECFDPNVNNWKKVSSMKTSRRGIAVGALDGAIYAVGGLDDTACFQIVERYDIDADTWTTVAEMRVQRGGVGVAALGKYLFAVGGNDGTTSLDSCERYDPLLDKWKMVAKMTNRRAGAGVCVMDGYLYAIGGFDDNSPLSTCERYDPTNDEWTQLAQMSCARGGVGVASMGGLVYAIGGHDGVRYLNSVEAFDPLTNSWTPVAHIKECRAGAGVAWAECCVDDLLRSPLSSSLTQDSGCAPSAQGVPHCV